ncbi:MAG: prenyltransferase [Marinicella sp.]|nr:prenyltransferase [Xanthomonadales bacterium]
MTGSHLKALLMSLRLPFLLLTPICLSLGVVFAYQATGFVDVSKLMLILLGGLSAHASVNLFNEYSDYQSGLDKLTEKTPFSGGSGGLLVYPEALNTVRKWAVIALIISIVIGLYFVLTVSLLLFPLGFIGALLVVFYTEQVNRWPWLCLVAPGIAFGPIMVLGAFLALTGQLDWTVLWISMVPFFMVNNLLLLNQLPDIDADHQVGRLHIPIRYGWKISLLIYGLFAVATTVTLYLLRAEKIIIDNWGWIWSPAIASLVVLLGTFRNQRKTTELIPYLGINVLITLLTPVLLSLGLH